MSTYFGTDNDDSIDGSDLLDGITNIEAKGGDDTLFNLSSVFVIAGPGNDSISGTDVRYMLWRSPSSPTVNLKNGFALDGFGYKDTLNGVTRVQLPTDKQNPVDATVIGSDNDEIVSLRAGNNVIDLGRGDDLVVFYESDHSNFNFEYNNDSVIVKNIKTGEESNLTGVETLQFRKESPIGESYDEYLTRVVYTEDIFTAPISGFLKNEIHRFSDTSVDSNGRIYMDKYFPGGLLEFEIQTSFFMDLNKDGSQDVVLPIMKGYATGENTRTPFIAFLSTNDTLNFDASTNLRMPVTSSAVEAEPITLSSKNDEIYLTVNIDTREVSARNGYKNDPAKFPSELTLTQPTDSSLKATSIFPLTPEAIPGFPLAINAHAFAVGDITGDGLDDVWIAQGGSSGGFQLTQKQDSTFNLSRDDFQKLIGVDWPNDDGSAGDNGIISQILIDVNNDGYDDLIVGWGHTGATSSYVFVNNNGSFSFDSRIQIPPSTYGVSNQQALKILSADFNHDGNSDLAIQYVRQEPFYGGDYWQILLNDGAGNFSDVTDLILGWDQNAYGDRQTHALYGQLIDVNGDGHIDLTSYRTSNENPLLYLNDGKGQFEILEVPTNKVGSIKANRPAVYYDFDGDGLMEFVSMNQFQNIAKTESTNIFYLHEFDKLIGTGPKYAVSASLGVPGFNEKYYLNTHSVASEAVTSGAYPSGLEHYLAEGKKAGLSAFAPFTKISGSADIDVVTLPKKSTDYSVDTSQKTWGIVENFDTTQYSVTDVERIAFSDKHVAYDIEGNAGNAIKLLGALAGKEASMNKTYLGEGLKLLDAGMPYEQLMDLAVNAILGPNPAGSTVVSLLYKHAAGTEAPQAVLDEYGALIDSGLTSASQLAMSVAEHSINATNLDLIGLSQTGVEYIFYI
ncbi:VCBS repeat-containing protein [Gammaproteobacteria bacterium]|nr:VCBS repeat-containing protein [Gammaproteobacteria bacterium]